MDANNNEVIDFGNVRIFKVFNAAGVQIEDIQHPNMMGDTLVPFLTEAINDFVGDVTTLRIEAHDE